MNLVYKELKTEKDIECYRIQISLRQEGRQNKTFFWLHTLQERKDSQKYVFILIHGQ